MDSDEGRTLSRWAAGAIVLVVIGVPLVGTALAGRDLRPLFQFPPPLEIPDGYVRFSWLAAGAVLALLGAIAVSWWRDVMTTARPAGPGGQITGARFAWWGWAAVAWTLGWWVLAWTRFEWFDAWQRYTFFPLWLGFIVAVNALTQRRVATCLLRRAPRTWLGLFVASAAFWWGFEWLNRFVRNWHYLGAEEFGPWSYAVHASVCFSTVLPAVAAVAEWLGAHAGWMRRAEAGPAWPWFARRGTAMALVAGAVISLAFTGVRPTWFYPALWVAPLALGLGAQVLGGRRSVAVEVARGDWSRAATWMFAAVICGFFWELWNWHSVAKWIYTVPGVERWHVFEMPLLGYAGYLPFGLECWMVVEWLGAGGRVTCTRSRSQLRAGRDP